MRSPQLQQSYLIVIHRVLLRISADCQQTLFPMSKKFGFSEKEARDLLQLAKSLELEVLGIR